MHLNPQAKEKWIALVKTKLTEPIHTGLHKKNNKKPLQEYEDSITQSHKTRAVSWHDTSQ